MPISMPNEAALPPGPVRQLVLALHALYRDAGMPGTRTISAAVRKNQELPDTLSHEAIGLILRGRSLIRWSKLESLVRQLCAWDVTGAHEAKATVRAFHALWLAATVHGAPTAVHSTVPAVVGGHRSASGAMDTRSLPPPPPPVVDNLPPRHPAFANRPSLLSEVRDLFDSRPGPVVLVGQGGMGKSQLALEYAHRYRPGYQIVWWVPAENASQIRASFRELAERLRLGVGRNLAQGMAAVVEALETRTGPWLLVLDNVDHPDEVLPALPDYGGHVLITTRNPEVGALGSPVPVGVFERSESITMLRTADRTATSSEAEQVAERLGDLPLALAQVVAQQSATGMSLSRYLEVFDGHLEELLAQGRPPHYETTLTALVELAVRQLARRSPASTELFEVLAHLGPEAVPFALLRAGRSGTLSPVLARCVGDGRRLERATLELTRYGVATWYHNPDRVLVHRLVSTCLQQVLPDVAVRRGAANARALLVAADPGDPDDRRTWGIHALIAPRVLSTGLIDTREDRERQVTLHVMRYLYQAGDYDGSRRLAETALQAWSARSGSDAHPGEREREVTASWHLGNALRNLGQYVSSAELTSQLHLRLRSDPHFGQDHPLTLRTAATLAYAQRICGDYRAALALDQDTLERRLRLDGPDHPHTLRARNNLAVCLRLLGDYRAAFQHDQAVHASRSRLLGVNDVLVYTSALNLVWDRYGLGQYPEMLSEVSDLVVTLETQLGAAHPLSLLASRAHAVALRSCGRAGEAVEMAASAHERHLRHLGPDHERSLAAALSYTNALRSVGRVADAHELAVEIQESYRRQFGWESPVTSAASVTLAATMRAASLPADPRPIDSQAHRTLEAVLGPSHPFVLSAANGLAGDLVQAGAPLGAATVLTQAIESARTNLGPDHPAVLAATANLATAHRAAGDRSRADRLIAEARDGLLARLGGDHPQVVACTSGDWIELDVEPPPA